MNKIELNFDGRYFENQHGLVLSYIPGENFNYVDRKWFWNRSTFESRMNLRWGNVK